MAISLMKTQFLILFGLVTVWLVALSYEDWGHRRLPNFLTLPGWVVIPLVCWLLCGPKAAAMSLVCGLIGGAFLLLPYLLRGAGAGDVKMLFACSCLAGLCGTPFFGLFAILVIMSVSGLFLGIGMLVWGKVSGARLKHLARCCVDVTYDKERGREQLPDKKNEKVRIPYGVAIAIGTWGYMLWLVLSAFFLRRQA